MRQHIIPAWSRLFIRILVACAALLSLAQWSEARVITARWQAVEPAGANTVLRSSAFASGNSGSAMTSTSYRMLGVVGEMGLPNNETTLSSANYQHQPGFLAGGIQANTRVFLPLALRNYVKLFTSSSEQEDNDTAAQANGALISGQDYTGVPDDQNDYFSFYAFGPGPISINLTGISGSGIQLQLYADTVSANTLVISDASAEYHIDYNGPSANRYFVRIYVNSGTNNAPYTLRVIYP